MHTNIWNNGSEGGGVTVLLQGGAATDTAMWAGCTTLGPPRTTGLPFMGVDVFNELPFHQFLADLVRLND